MSDPQAAIPSALPAAAAPAVDKKEWATRVIYDILALMELPARLEVKDAADGGISVALFFEGPVAGVQPGKRSHLIDALQFLSNKVVNRPNTERRWIVIGVGAHPEPRPAPGERRPVPATQAAPPAPTPQAERSGGKEKAGSRAPAPAKAPAPPAKSARGSEMDERQMEVSADKELAQVAELLARKSAGLGRFYGIAAMKPEDRARLVKAVEGVAGVSVKAEGEGRNRRVVFTPEKPSPLPKRTHPNFDDDEDELED